MRGKAHTPCWRKLNVGDDMATTSSAAANSLLTPIQLRDFPIRNRVVISRVCTYSAVDGLALCRSAKYSLVPRKPRTYGIASPSFPPHPGARCLGVIRRLDFLRRLRRFAAGLEPHSRRPIGGRSLALEMPRPGHAQRSDFWQLAQHRRRRGRLEQRQQPEPVLANCPGILLAFL
jgi:hypothetical protein